MCRNLCNMRKHQIWLMNKTILQISYRFMNRNHDKFYNRRDTDEKE